MSGSAEGLLRAAEGDKDEDGKGVLTDDKRGHSGSAGFCAERLLGVKGDSLKLGGDSVSSRRSTAFSSQ